MNHIYLFAFVVQVFDILWEAHQRHGHQKTPAVLHQLVRDEGMFGIPRKACECFIACCHICSKQRRVLKKVYYVTILS